MSGPRLVGEAAFRRLSTPRGTLRGGEDEALYGEDLSNLVGTVQSDNDAAAVPARVKNELEKEDRIETLDVAATLEKVGGKTTIRIAIVAHTGSGPFTLTVRVSEFGVELVGLTP